MDQLQTSIEYVKGVGPNRAKLLKEELNILTYRDKSFSSPVTGSVAPIHHTPWEKAMDDSMETFLNK